MAEVHRLASCQRCHHLFVARPGQRICPDCQQAIRRARGRAWSSGRAAHPLLVFAVGSGGLALAATWLRPGSVGLAAWVGAAAALWWLVRQS